MAWFAVGCYYQAIGRYDSARQYFGKATAVDPSFAPAWLGFGHSFAAQDESDQVRPAPAQPLTAQIEEEDSHSSSVYPSVSGYIRWEHRLSGKALRLQLFLASCQICRHADEGGHTAGKPQKAKRFGCMQLPGCRCTLECCALLDSRMWRVVSQDC